MNLFQRGLNSKSPGYPLMYGKRLYPTHFDYETIFEVAKKHNVVIRPNEMIEL